MKTKTIKGSSQVGVILAESILKYLYEEMRSSSHVNNELDYTDLSDAYNNKSLLIHINNYTLDWDPVTELYPGPCVHYNVSLHYTGDNKAIIEAVKIWEAVMEDINGEWDGIEADEAEGEDEDEPIHESTEEKLAYFAVNWKDSQDLLSEDKIEELRTAFDDDIVESNFNEEYPFFPPFDVSDQHLIYFKDNPPNMTFMWINVREGLRSEGYSSNGTDARRELYKLNNDVYIDILDHVLGYINLTRNEYKNLSSDFQLEIDKVVREIFEYIAKVKYEG